MKKRLIWLLAISFAGLLFVACAEDKDALEYVNKSYQNIYVFKTYSSDQILPMDEEYLGQVIYPYYRGGRFQSYTDYIYPDYAKYDTLYTTVLSADTLSKYAWKQVRDHTMILRRDSIPLNESYLKSINWRIEYP